MKLRELGDAVIGTVVVGALIVVAAIDTAQRQCPHIFWKNGGETCEQCGISWTRFRRLRDQAEAPNWLMRDDTSNKRKR